MITIRFRDETMVLEQSHSLAEILVMKNYHGQHFAVALNRQFIPRSNHVTTFIQDGDVVDVISPMQGG